MSESIKDEIQWLLLNAEDQVRYFEAEIKTVAEKYGARALELCGEELQYWKSQRDDLKRRLKNGR